MQQNSKSEIRKKLEDLEDHIHKSWLKDLDKVKEFMELDIILEELLTKDSIEEFFANIQSDVDYFIKKFSQVVISNILRQHIIYGKGGDDVAFGVLVKYLWLFNKFMHVPNYYPLWEFVKEIFDYSKSYYKGSISSSSKVNNEKKMISAEKFNVSFIKQTNVLLIIIY